MNKVSVSICIQVLCGHVLIFLSKYLGMKLLSHIVSVYLNLEETAKHIAV